MTSLVVEPITLDQLCKMPDLIRAYNWDCNMPERTRVIKFSLNGSKDNLLADFTYVMNVKDESAMGLLQKLRDSLPDVLQIGWYDAKTQEVVCKDAFKVEYRGFSIQGDAGNGTFQTLLLRLKVIQ